MEGADLSTFGMSKGHWLLLGAFLAWLPGFVPSVSPARAKAKGLGIRRAEIATAPVETKALEEEPWVAGEGAVYLLRLVFEGTMGSATFSFALFTFYFTDAAVQKSSRVDDLYHDVVWRIQAWLDHLGTEWC